MTRTQQIALQCAAAVRKQYPFLLSHQVRSERTLGLIKQLDACKDDSARRLITGKSR